MFTGIFKINSLILFLFQDVDCTMDLNLWTIWCEGVASLYVWQGMVSTEMISVGLKDARVFRIISDSVVPLVGQAMLNYSLLSGGIILSVGDVYDLLETSGPKDRF